MEKIILTEGQKMELTESLKLSQLTVAPGSGFVTARGKTVTMTVDGVETAVLPGEYSGDIVLTVAKGYGMGGDFRTALYIENGEVDKDISVTAAVSGEYDGKSMKDVSIRSNGPEFCGVTIKNGKYDIKNLSFEFNGRGGDDFSGRGCALTIGGDAEVDIDGFYVRSNGLTRSGLIATDDSRVTIRNADVQTWGATDEEQEEIGKIIHGMISVPWVLGLYGNNRATNVLTRAHVTYLDSKFKAERWGVLSTDGPASPEGKLENLLFLTAKNCEIEITGDSGYGTYCIGSGRNDFFDCTFKVPDYAMVVANEIASSDFVNTTVDSQRFGVMWHQNQGGVLKVKDSTFNTGKTTFLVKGCYPRIEVENSALNTGNGVVLQLMDSDDPGLGPKSVEVDTKVAVKDETHDVSKVNSHDVYMYNRIQENYVTDLVASFKDMTINGSFYNAITNAVEVGSVNLVEAGLAPAPEGMPMMPPMDGDMPGGPEGPEGGMPGGPDGMPGEPGEDFVPPMMPSMPASNYPINLALTLENVELNGAVSASTTKHAVKVISKENRRELGEVTNTPCPVVNNGVILELKGKTVWNVTGDSYLSALTVGEEAVINGTVTVDGVEVAPKGSYTGNILVRK